MTENPKLPAIQSDGFDDAGNEERVIRGTLLKCVDGAWSTRDDTPLPKALMAVGTDNFLQKWQEQKPVETIIDKPLPNVDALNGAIPESEWEEGIDGKPRPPWQHQYAVYLVNPADGSVYTFCNSTVGAAMAYRNLKERVGMMRKMQGVSVYPVVQLGKATFQGKFGPKITPEFNIVDWRELGGDGAALPSAPVAQIEHKPTETPKEPVQYGKPVKPPSLSEELNDDLPEGLKKKTA
jgi:hypothetical protein